MRKLLKENDERLFQTANIPARETGLPYDVRIGSPDRDGYSRRGRPTVPKILVNVKGRLIPVSISPDNPRIPKKILRELFGGHPFKYYKAVKCWITVNYDALLQHWNKKLTDLQALNLLTSKKVRIIPSDDDSPDLDDIVIFIVKEFPWIVRKVTPQDDYTLLLQFDDGKIGVFDMWPIIQQEDGGDDAFAHLKNLDEFMKAYVHLHAVFWPGDISIAPETLYKECMTRQEYEDWCAEYEESAKD